MYNHICKNCSKEFTHGNRYAKYCCRDCYEKSKTGQKRSSSFKIGQAERSKKFAQTEEGKLNYTDRGVKISQSKMRPLTEEERLKVNEILNWRYVRDSNLLLKHSKLNSTYKRRLENYIDEIKDTELYKNVFSFIPTKIQKLNINEFELFVNDSLKLDHSEMETKYKFSKNAYFNLCQKIPELKWNKITQNIKGETSIEKLVREFLECNYSNVKREQYINSDKWRVDFLINDVYILEVNGDFWHANPKFFDYDNLHEIQKQNIISNKEKELWIKNNGYFYLEVWEYDVKNQFCVVEEQIKNFIQ